MKPLLKLLLQPDSLSTEATEAVFEKMLDTGEHGATDAQIGAYFFALARRLPSSEELVGAARSLRKHLLPLDISGFPKDAIFVDTCGTGGSGLDTFNTSTAVAFVAAAAGLYVAKHGNRASTSACGSADVLEALGVKLDLNQEQLADSLSQHRFAFLFAPRFHPATKRVQGIRRELGFRTIFNFLGPLVNPAGVKRQLLGVSEKNMLTPMAEALLALGGEHALVVCGEDGLDELSLTGPSLVSELHHGVVRSYTLKPEDFGLTSVSLGDIQGAAPGESARIMRTVLNGTPGPRKDLVLLNAGAVLYIGGEASSIADGIQKARKLLDDGSASAVLDRLVR